MNVDQTEVKVDETTHLKFVPALRCLMMSAVMIISRASAPPPPAATPISLDLHSSPSNENSAHSFGRRGTAVP